MKNNCKSTNNKLVAYKETIFIKIFNFFKRIFSKKNISATEKLVKNKEKKVSFFENIRIKEDEEEIRLKKLEIQYDNGEIDEDDLSETDIKKLITLYENETKQLNDETEMIKKRTYRILTELK